MKHAIFVATLLAALAISPLAQAQTHGAHAGHEGHDAHMGKAVPAGAHMNDEMTRGEIRKWDPKQGKVTIRHEEQPGHHALHVLELDVVGLFDEHGALYPGAGQVQVTNVAVFREVDFGQLCFLGGAHGTTADLGAAIVPDCVSL